MKMKALNRVKVIETNSLSKMMDNLISIKPIQSNNLT